MTMDHQPFYLGVNYPWLHYAEDFGTTPSGHRGVSVPENRSWVDTELGRIRDCGAKVVRWFLFGDGRSGFRSENGIANCPDPLLFPDLGALLDLARRHDLRLCLSLVDYLWLQDRVGEQPSHPNEHVLHFAAGREAFLHRVLIPMLREFRGHPALFAWEIANEPEWSIREFHRVPAARMHYADFRAFAVEVAEAVREYANVPVTLGSARLDWLRAWMDIGLDFYQAHYYPAGANGDQRGLAAQLLAVHSLDKPLWLGELPAQDDRTPAYSVEAALTVCREAGLLGAAIWRWTLPQETDSDHALGTIDPAILDAWNSSARSKSAVV